METKIKLWQFKVDEETSLPTYYIHQNDDDKIDLENEEELDDCVVSLDVDIQKLQYGVEGHLTISISREKNDLMDDPNFSIMVNIGVDEAITICKALEAFIAIKNKNNNSVYVQ